MTTRIKWTGIDKLGRKFDEAIRDNPKVVAAALFQEGEKIMATSVKDTPVDTGRLRSTGHVKDPKISGKHVTVILAYGTDYAIFVHEIPGRNHPVGKAKFLEDAMMGAASGMGGRLADRIGRELKRKF